MLLASLESRLEVGVDLLEWVTAGEPCGEEIAREPWMFVTQSEE